MYSVGDEPGSIATADFDGNGELDLAVANLQSNDITILENTGSRTFTAGATIGLSGNYPGSLTTVDLNMDSQPDLLVSMELSAADGAVSVLLGNGNGTFAPESVYLAGSGDLSAGFSSIAVGDMNDDGLLDVARSTQNGDISILAGVGDGKLRQTQFGTGSDPLSVDLADLNFDGHLDMVVPNFQDRDITVRLGEGNGNFGSDIRTAIPFSANHAVTTHLDGDGILDLVTANANDDNITTLLGNADGTFGSPSSYDVGAAPFYVVVADLNGDSLTDVVTANIRDHTLSVLLGNGDGSFGPQTVLPSHIAPVSVDVADFNGDTIPDLVSGHPLSVLPVYLGLGGGAFAAANVINTNNSTRSVRAGDLNGDGIPDLATASEAADEISVFLGVGDGTFGAETSHAVGNRPHWLTIADLNGDRALDLATTNFGSDDVSVLLGDGDGIFQDQLRFNTANEPYAFAAEDVDEDGRQDLVIALLNDDMVQVLLGRGLQSKGRPALYKYDPVFKVVTSATDELGRQTLYDIDPANGNTLSVTRVIGLPDSTSGETDDITTAYTYTPEGLIDTITDPLGRVSDYDYDTNGRLQFVTYAVGTAEQATREYEYDAAGNTTAEIDELGHRTVYVYDELNRLERMTEADPDGPGGPLGSPVTLYDYDARGNLKKITDPQNNTTEYAYDELNRISIVTDADLNTTQYIYDEHGNLASTVDRLGRQTFSEYDERNRLIRTTDPEGGVEQYVYDLDNNLTQMIDKNGNTTQYEYDARDRQYRTIDALGGITEIEFDAANNVAAQIDELGRRTEFEYDDLYRQTVVRLPDIDGDPLTTGDIPTTVYVYDDASNLTSVIDVEGNSTDYVYDGRDRMTKQIMPDPGPSASHGRPEIEYIFDDTNRLTNVFDPLGRETTYEYDDLNRRTKEIYPDIDGDPQTTGDRPEMTYTFDAVGNELTMTDALLNVTTYEYDKLYRLIKLTEPDPDGPLPTHQSPLTSFQYDAADQLLTVTDPLNRTTTYDYDLLGRVTKETYPDPVTGIAGPLSPFMTYTYDPMSNVLSHQDALGHQTVYTYDKLYRRTSETDANGDTTTFAYNAVDNLVTLTDPPTTSNPTGNITTWVYDNLNRPTEEGNDVGDSRFYSYDLVSNEISMTDRNGRVTQYEYDNLYRRVMEEWLDGSQQPFHDFTFTYDIASQMLTAGDAAATYTYVYDGLGRPTQVNHSFAGLTPDVVFDQTYDFMNNREQLAAEIGGTDDFVNDYTYDNLYRTIQIDQHGVVVGNAVADKRIDFTWDIASQPDLITRYADLAGTETVAITDFDFDLTGRLTDLEHSAPGEGILADYDWVFDTANRITQFASLTDGTVDYNYDDRDQLTGADYDYQTDENYTYDENGNRTNTGYVTGDLNRLLDDGTFTYAYDAEGNRTKRIESATGETTVYAWDHRNRLTTISTYDEDPALPSAETLTKQVTQTYDVYNRWIGREVDPDGDSSNAAIEETFFVHDAGQIVLQFDGTAAADLSQRYLWANAVDQIMADEQVTDLVTEGDVLWPLTDNLGTIRDLAQYDTGTNTTTIANHITYDAFGNVVSETGTVDHLFGFTGRAFDEETGLQNNLNRWYDPVVGRWLSEDPIGFNAGDANFYRYVGNKATRFIDPSGLEETPTGWELEPNTISDKTHGEWGGCKYGEPCPVLLTKMYKWMTSASIRLERHLLDQYGFGKPGTPDFNLRRYNDHIDKMQEHRDQAFKCWKIYQEQCKNNCPPANAVPKPKFQSLPEKDYGPPLGGTPFSGIEEGLEGIFSWLGIEGVDVPPIIVVPAPLPPAAGISTLPVAAAAGIGAPPSVPPSPPNDDNQ